MDAIADLTVSQKILVAASTLPQPFHESDLTEAVWQAHPKDFGMRHKHEKYPDVNRVRCCIVGERGLARRGWLVKQGQLTYALSRQGAEEVRRILAGDDPQPKRRALAKIQVPKELEQQLVALFTTTAFRRYEEGMKREITYRDACRFWALAEIAHGDAVDVALATVPRAVAVAQTFVVGDVLALDCGMEIRRKELDRLTAVQKFLTEQFARNLEQQRKRAFRRIA
jgi:hypothetical protein